MNDKPNIIFVVLDGVGAQGLSCYGNHQKTSPRLDAFAKDCLLYRRAFTPANNSNSSHTSLLTGLYPKEHGTTANQPFFMKQDFSLAPLLRSAGYATCMINPVYLLSDYFGHTFGFDQVFQMWQLLEQGCDENIFFDSDFNKLSGNGKIYDCFKRLMHPRKSGPTLVSMINLVYSRMFDIYKSSEHATKKAVDIAIQVLKQKGTSPVFLYLVLLEAHEEYNPPAHSRRKFNIPRKLKSCHQLDHYTGKSRLDLAQFSQQRKMYEAAVYYQDSQLGRLLDYLSTSGVGDRSLVVITGDHGEHFGEKGHCGNLASLYNEIIHVPLLAKYPASVSIKPGENNDLVQTTDIHATILDLVRLPASNNSFSLLGQKKRNAAYSQMLPQDIILRTLAKDNIQLEAAALRQLSQELRCIITQEGWKYIVSPESQWLYDLNADPYEEVDLSQEVKYSEIKNAAAALLTGFFSGNR